MSEVKTIREVVEATGKYTGLTHGNSMEPLIHQNRDNIIIIKAEKPLKKYDIPVYVTPSGKNIMHRIVKVCDDHYVIIGDNRKEKEIVTDDMIYGKLVGFYKDGKRYIDLESSKLYKAYSKIWVALYPIRPLTIFINRVIGFVRRRVFKKRG